MTHAKMAISIVIFVTILSFPFDDSQSAAAGPIEALKFCARTESTEERYACYDALAKRGLDEETVLSESPAATDSGIRRG